MFRYGGHLNLIDKDSARIAVSKYFNYRTIKQTFHFVYWRPSRCPEDSRV